MMAYACQSYQNQCLRDKNLFCTPYQDCSRQSLLPPCKPPEKLYGQDVEIAIRKQPYKPYPQKPAVKSSLEPSKRSKGEVVGYRATDFNNIIVNRSVIGPAWTPRYCLRRIHALLIREETEQMETRLKTLWATYERQAADVFVYENMDLVANIILLLSTSFIRLKFAQKFFDKIMQRLQRGIFMESSKELMDVNRLAYFFTVLGLAIVEGHPYAQKSISSILGVWLENLIDKRHRRIGTKQTKCSLTSSLMTGSNQLSVMVPNNVLLTALETSLLPRTVGKYLKDGLHTEGYVSILSLLKLCCDSSALIRERLWCLPILDPVLLKLCIADQSNRILIRTNDFVYSYLGANSLIHRDKLGTVPALDKEPFQVLLTRFSQQLALCSSKSLLSTRNDTAFLICLIGKRIPAAGQYFQGYTSILAAIISTGVLGKKGIDFPYLIDSTPEDLELLQYVIYMLTCVVEAGCGEKVINDYNTVSVLLILILGPCVLTEETALQGNDLDTAAWSAIQAITKYFPLSMLTPHGVPSLLSFLKAYGDLGEGDQTILAMAMHTLRILLTTEDASISDEVMAYFMKRDAMPIFLSVLKQLTKENFDMLQETVISNALYCCAALGFYDLNQKEVFTCLEGVSILTRLMRHLLYHSPQRRHMDPVVQIALAEVTWGCVAYYPSCLERFLAYEGLFRLLDVLEISAGPAAPVHIINCVLQLCDYPRCMDQLLYWQRPMKNLSQRVVFGKEVGPMARSLLSSDEKPASGDSLQDLAGYLDQSLASMLCVLWRDEETRFEVLRDPDGCIASLTHPLMSKFAREYDSTGQTGIFRTCLDMSLSLRPKIFLLIKRIVEITKTEATLFDDLSQNNQIVMQVIINFFDLKKSEVYLEMMNEKHREGFPFVPSDEAAVSKLITVSKNKVVTVLETQRYLIRRSKEKAETNENEFYSLMKRCRLQDHLIAAREIDYLARTTNYQFLVEKRLWQKSALESTEKELDVGFTKNSSVHRTSDGRLNITAWSARARCIDSEPIINKEEFLPDQYEDNEIEEPNDGEEEDDDKDTADGSITAVATALNVTAFASDTDAITPEPLEGGFYQISPHLLRDALEQLLSERKRHDWVNLMDENEDTFWKMRTKWKQEWYPVDE